MSNKNISAQIACCENQLNDNNYEDVNDKFEDKYGLELLAEAALLKEKMDGFGNISNNDDNKTKNNDKLTASTSKIEPVSILEKSQQLNESNVDKNVANVSSSILKLKTKMIKMYQNNDKGTGKENKLNLQNNSPLVIEENSSSTASVSPSTVSFEAEVLKPPKCSKTSERSINPILNKDDNKLKEFIKSVDIKPKNEAKIQIKTPKSTYTLSGLRSRKKATKTPDNLKTEEFYLKRQKNNLSAQKSREKKNLAILATELKVKICEEEQLELEFEIGKEIMIMKRIQEKLNNQPKLKEQFMELIKNQQLNYFTKTF